MLNTKIQVPISSVVLEKARKRADEMGFSSVNDVVRIMIKLFGDKKVNFELTSKYDENGLEYVSEEEQKEIVEKLKRNKRLGLDKIVKTEVIKL